MSAGTSDTPWPHPQSLPAPPPHPHPSRWPCPPAAWEVGQLRQAHDPAGTPSWGRFGDFQLQVGGPAVSQEESAHTGGWRPLPLFFRLLGKHPN